MKTTFLALLTLLGVFAISAAAADITGKWTAEVQGQNGTQTTTFQLKADGSTVTGSVATQRGETPIADGKIDGDTVTFTTTMKRGDNEVKMTYTGKISGDSIQFKREMGGGQRPPQEFTAKKTTT